jgi:hypothetical protein
LVGGKPSPIFEQTPFSKWTHAEEVGGCPTVPTIAELRECITQEALEYECLAVLIVTTGPRLLRDQLEHLRATNQPCGTDTASQYLLQTPSDGVDLVRPTPDRTHRSLGT